MKTLLLLAVMLSWCFLPAPVRGGDNLRPELKVNNSNDRLRRDRQRCDSLGAKQGAKALANVRAQHAKNQAEVNRAIKNMQKIKMPTVTRPNF